MGCKYLRRRGECPYGCVKGEYVCHYFAHSELCRYGDTCKFNRSHRELSNSERGRGCDRVGLGDPRHALASCGWANTPLRLALDGKAYTLGEFEEEHRGWAIWCWQRTQPLNPVSFGLYCLLREDEKEACHQALLRILGKHCDYIKGRGC